MKNSQDCERCWASTRIADQQYYCMFPHCPYKREKDPFRLKGLKAEHKPEKATDNKT